MATDSRWLNVYDVAQAEEATKEGGGVISRIGEKGMGWNDGSRKEGG